MTTNVVYNKMVLDALEAAKKKRERKRARNKALVAANPQTSVVGMQLHPNGFGTDNAYQRRLQAEEDARKEAAERAAARKATGGGLYVPRYVKASAKQRATRATQAANAAWTKR